MPEQPAIPAPYTSYQQILSALVASATGVIEILSAEMRAKHALPLEIVTRDFLLLSAVVRRAVAAALHLRTLPPAPEEAAGQITTMLDAVLTAFARHKMDIDTYHRMVDAELDAECDDDDDGEEDDADDFDPPDDEKEERDDLAGARPGVLVAGLCRDFGLVAADVPPHWLANVPPELRLLCARAAAASIGPAAKPGRLGHLMER